MHEHSQIKSKHDVYCISDVQIIGGGPAGLILAYACLLKGFTVCLVDESISRGWHQNYCFWNNELDGSGLQKEYQNLFMNSICQKWDQATVHIGGKVVTINASYSKFDNTALKRRLIEQIQQLGGHIFEDSIEKIEHLDDYSMTVGQRCYQSKVVVVATGAGTNLLSHKGGDPGLQIAYGQHLDLRASPYTVSSTVGFMNFDVEKQHRHLFQYPPSFLYTLPTSGDSVFLEETILVTKEGVDWDMLKERLDIRKRGMNLQNCGVLDEEFCVIPMGGSLPEFERTLAFGASAGFVHPVTGFQMIRSIRTAPRFVQYLRDNWHRDVDELCEHAWDSIWSSNELLNRRLYMIGLDVLTQCNLEETQSFFDAFFKNTDSNRSAFLSGWASTSEVQSTMWQTFRHANWGTKSLIVRHSKGHLDTLCKSLLGTAALEHV